MCRFALKAMAVQLRSINRKPVDGFNGSENSGCRRFRSYRSRGCKAVSGSWLQGNSNANTFRIGFGGRRKGFRFFSVPEAGLVVLAAGRLAAFSRTNLSRLSSFPQFGDPDECLCRGRSDWYIASCVIWLILHVSKECPQPMSEDMLGTGNLSRQACHTPQRRSPVSSLGFRTISSMESTGSVCDTKQRYGLVIISIHSLAVCWPHWSQIPC